MWPYSRKQTPKQMLKLIGDESLFQIAVNRLWGAFEADHILVVTGADQAERLAQQVPAIPRENFILETVPRGTASAIGLTAAILQKRDPQASMAVLTADHYIANTSLFQRILKAADKLSAEEYLVTLGIEPTFPSTGYGYIQSGKELGEYDGFDAHKVRKFKEKPERDDAREMIKDGDHYWNSGMFVWKVETILNEMDRQLPKLAAVLKQVQAASSPADLEAVMQDPWMDLVSETIDYGVMEHAKKVAVIPAREMGWSDVGTWDAFYDILDQDESGNVVKAKNSLQVATKRTVIFSQTGRLVATLGVKDLIVVDTEDVVLVCNREHAEKVKELLAKAKEEHKEDFL